MPLHIRKYYLDETLKIMKAKSGDKDDSGEPHPLVLNQSRAPQHNSPEVRALTGRDPYLPPRMIKMGD